jgi:shikimate dehydrogenase
MKCYGLIGFPLTHSFSQKYFTDKFEREGIIHCSYANYPIENIGFLPHLIAGNENLMGLNVTIPYKEQVIPYLDEVDDNIPLIGAVNTLKITRKSGKIHLKGYNTDVYGFSASLKPYLKEHYQKALILGTGGASKAAAFVLEGLGFEITWVSRNPKNDKQVSYARLTPELVAGARVIVNTSPLGMYPDTGSCPDIPYEAITPDHVLFDMIYNPPETKFMTLGGKQGAKVINGLKMLHLQAERSWKIWNSEC